MFNKKSFLLILIFWLPVTALAGGNQWTSCGPEGGEIRALAIDPLRPSTLYAGAYDMGSLSLHGRIYKSTDGGTNWSDLGVVLYPNALAIDPVTTTTLYAGKNDGVLKSTDGGISWSDVSAGLLSNSVDALAIDPATPTTLYAGTTNGVFKSIDGGANWFAINAGLTNNEIQVLVINPTVTNTIYAGTKGGGVFKSIDGGANWFASNNGLTNLYVRAIAIDPVTTSTLYSGTRNLGVFKSVDGGVNWFVFNTGLMAPLDNVVNDLAIDPVYPATLYAGIIYLNFKTSHHGMFHYNHSPNYNNDDSGGGCFIATAAYKSRIAGEVVILRNFRDNILSTNVLGKRLVEFYYHFSPPMANFIAKHEFHRSAVRWGLLPLVGIGWFSLKIGLAATLVLLLLFLMSVSTLVFYSKRRLRSQIN
jgi:hypothetical protein